MRVSVLISLTDSAGDDVVSVVREETLIGDTLEEAGKVLANLIDEASNRTLVQITQAVDRASA